MHDTTNETHWHEPKAGENAGFGKFLRKPMPYDSFMESEGVPVFRGIGVRRVQDHRGSGKKVPASLVTHRRVDTSTIFSGIQTRVG